MYLFVTHRKEHSLYEQPFFHSEIRHIDFGLIIPISRKKLPPLAQVISYVLNLSFGGKLDCERQHLMFTIAIYKYC